MGIKWKTTPEERQRITDIVKRACALDKSIDHMTLIMDITACHLNDCKLRLEALGEEANDKDLMRDVYGIMRNMNRKTGKLENMFVPRSKA
jgi:hypothetical protein